VSGALQQIILREPGTFGLNTEQALAVDDPRWCTEGTNLVFDDTNRLTSRKGLNNLTISGGHSDDVESIHEFIKDSSSSEIIHAAGLMVYTGTSTLTDISGTITTPTANDWQFVNFNGKCIGVQQGHTPIVYTGTGSFADITAATGSLPTGNCALAAFGRLWVADSDRVTLKFSEILDETNWASAGSGSLDTTEIWPDGLDQIVAIGEFQNQLLIFGKRSILVYTGADKLIDNTGQATVSLATSFQLYDIIRRGTNWRDSVVAIGNDLLFMSPDGLRSVSRGLESQTMPLTDLSTQVRSILIGQLDGATTVKAAYSPVDRAYLVRIDKSTGINYWYFDVGRRLPTGDLRAFRWTGINYTAITVASDNTVYLGTNGALGDHSGYTDEMSTYDVEWLTAGTELGVQGEKILKTGRFLVATNAENAFTLRWCVDFQEACYTAVGRAGFNNAQSEWNVAEWGLDEWSGTAQVSRELRVPLSHSGQIVQVGARATVSGFELAFANVTLLAKVGRLAA